MRASAHNFFTSSKTFIQLSLSLSIYIYNYKAPVEETAAPGHDATGATYMSRLRVERAPVAPDDAHAASLLFAAPAGVAARSRGIDIRATEAH